MQNLKSISVLVVFLLFQLSLLIADDIGITDRKVLTADKLAGEQIPLGEVDDYKPCIARLPSGELLLSAFHQHKRDGNKVMEQTLLFRSPDGGRTWSAPQPLDAAQ